MLMISVCATSVQSGTTRDGIRPLSTLLGLGLGLGLGPSAQCDSAQCPSRWLYVCLHAAAEPAGPLLPLHNRVMDPGPSPSPNRDHNSDVLALTVTVTLTQASERLILGKEASPEP